MTPKFASAAANPNAAAEAVAAALATSTTKGPAVPPIPLPNTDGHVSLPGGLITQEGAVLREAEVQELTGAHEEAIVRANQSGLFSRYIKVLLKSGVVSIGDQLPTDQTLSNLLIGDRDALIFGIRRATYGDEVEYPEVMCPHCRDVKDLVLNLNDVPVRELEDPTARSWVVPLRKGGHATVRMPTASDQDVIFDDTKLTIPEQNSVLLSRCVIALTGTDGINRPVTNVGPVRELGLVDRKNLIESIEKRQPGPRWDEISNTCENCGKEYPVIVTVGDLFFR